MSRTKQPLREYLAAHLEWVKAYFLRAIKHEKIFQYAPVELILAAEDEFKVLMLVANKNKIIDNLEHWIEKYISESQWHRCKTAIRQQELKSKKEYKGFHIPKNLWHELNAYASDRGLTKIKAMEEAIAIARKSLADNNNK